MKEKEDLDFLLLFYGFPHNRQGLDLNISLNMVGKRSHLIMFEIECSDTVTGLSYLPLFPGIFSKISVLLNCLRFVKAGWHFSPRCVIAFDSLSFILGMIWKVRYRSKMIYYSLEIESVGFFKKLFISRMCDGIINVEENRQQMLIAALKWTGPSLIWYNMPHRVEKKDLKPKLRSWLKNQKGIDNKKILAYIGSYQPYTKLENIVLWIRDLSPEIILVLMMPKIPTWLEREPFERVYILPTQSPDEVKHWLCDADVALLPYESDEIFVKYCSPQKVFDCLACGVPFLGSNRPIIRKIVEEFSCGIICDFTNKNSFEKAVNEIFSRDLGEMRKMAFEGHAVYHYEKEWPRFRRFLEDIVEKA